MKRPLSFGKDIVKTKKEPKKKLTVQEQHALRAQRIAAVESKVSA